MMRVILPPASAAMVNTDPVSSLDKDCEARLERPLDMFLRRPPTSVFAFDTLQKTCRAGWFA
jgi:hypothetical protein